ncbi:hypothetical protein C21_04793 [Arenibacter sp. NBRC 103722]|nr:hypothetical protein C21_04793 [Arenibacter sp. NBRC 103722]
MPPGYGDIGVTIPEFCNSYLFRTIPFGSNLFTNIVHLFYFPVKVGPFIHRKCRWWCWYKLICRVNNKRPYFTPMRLYPVHISRWGGLPTRIIVRVNSKLGHSPSLLVIVLVQPIPYMFCHGQTIFLRVLKDGQVFFLPICI